MIAATTRISVCLLTITTTTHITVCLRRQFGGDSERCPVFLQWCDPMLMM